MSKEYCTKHPVVGLHDKARGCVGFVEADYNAGDDLSDPLSATPWQQAVTLCKEAGLTPDSPCYGEVLGLALEYLQRETERAQWQVEHTEQEAERYEEWQKQMTVDGYANRNGTFSATTTEVMMRQREEEARYAALRAEHEIERDYVKDNDGVWRKRDGIPSPVVGRPETFPPDLVASESVTGITISGIKKVYVGDTTYGIDEISPFTQTNPDHHDRRFAAPILPYLKAQGLDAGNIEKVEYLEQFDMIAYQWPDITLAFNLDTQTWNPPFNRLELRRYMDAMAKEMSAIAGNPPTYTVPDVVYSKLTDEITGLRHLFDNNGIAQTTPTCTRCGGGLEADRTTVCKVCEPNKD